MLVMLAVLCCIQASEASIESKQGRSALALSSSWGALQLTAQPAYPECFWWRRDGRG